MRYNNNRQKLLINLMATEAETMSEENLSSNRINKIDVEKEENNKNSLTNEEALDIQIKYLQSSKKNVLFSIIQNEPDPMSYDYKIIKNKNIEPGIFLYLQNIYNKHYCHEINYIVNTINSKISYINEKNKEIFQNKKFIEREINTVSKEKIDYFNEQENLDKELELLKVNSYQNNYICKTECNSLTLNLKRNLNNTNNAINDDFEISQKTKKLEELKKKYNKLFDELSSNKKQYPLVKSKNSMTQGENMVLNEKLKQKQMILEQMRRDNENVKSVVIKRDYSHLEKEKKDNKKEENKKENKHQNKNLKVSKIGSFLKNFMSNKK